MLFIKSLSDGTSIVVSSLPPIFEVLKSIAGLLTHLKVNFPKNYKKAIDTSRLAATLVLGLKGRDIGEHRTEGFK